MLARFIEGKILSIDYSPTEIMKDLEPKLGITLSYMQSWRARECVRLLVMEKPVDHYKLLPWMCAAIERANPDSRAFVELDGCRFKRMFVSLGAALKCFIMRCRKMLFVDETHLSGPYEGTLLTAVALDADNHVFDVAYAVVEGETNEDSLWFLSTLHQCLRVLKSVIMSDRNKGLVEGAPLVFGADNHTYCVRHLMENMLTEAVRLGIRRNASKDILKEMFNRIAYATTVAEYDSAMDEPRRFTHFCISAFLLSHFKPTFYIDANTSHDRIIPKPLTPF